jgi:hypothetical protein
MIGFIGSSGDRAMLSCQKCQRVPKIKIAAKGFFNPAIFGNFGDLGNSLHRPARSA